jgi:hypothetical protein
MFVMIIFGWIAQSLAYIAEIGLYTFHAVWVLIVRAALALIETVDDWIPDLDVLDNAVLRALVMAVVGFLAGVLLMIFLSLIIGNWGIPCVFALTIAFCAFVGLVSDPEGDWSFGSFPSFGGGSSPQIPLNL